MQHTIKTFEDACKVKGLDPEKVLPDASTSPYGHDTAINAFAKLLIIAEALNEGWQPDWSNYDERKYYPWFDLEKSKSNPGGFVVGYAFDFATSYVGSRLCFKSRDLAQYAATQFADLYKLMMSF